MGYDGRELILIGVKPGRGISVCERWLDFANYWEDVKNIYKDELTIERIDNNGNYEPGNVTFITRAEQNKNKRYKIGKSGIRGVRRDRKN